VVLPIGRRVYIQEVGDVLFQVGGPEEQGVVVVAQGRVGGVLLEGRFEVGIDVVEADKVLRVHFAGWNEESGRCHLAGGVDEQSKPVIKALRSRSAVVPGVLIERTRPMGAALRSRGPPLWIASGPETALLGRGQTGLSDWSLALGAQSDWLKAA
jgi:hypothetical protein